LINFEYLQAFKPPRDWNNFFNLKQIIQIPFWLAISAMLLVAACSTPREFTAAEELDRAELDAEELISMIPDYRTELKTITGSGRAMVSEPGNSERVTLEFHSNRNESLMTVRNNVGIEGGQIYVDSDSLLIYNRVDRTAEKVPLHEGKLSSVGSIASINILDLINYTVNTEDISEIFEDRSYYYAILNNRTQIKISKQNGLIKEVVHSTDLYDAPYSRIEYEGYARIEGFHLPRRITIFSRDEASRATLMVQRLDVNTELPELAIVVPDDIPIQRL
jgi:hypothetical protein